MKKVATFIRQHRQFTVFAFFALLIILAAVFAPLIATHDPYESILFFHHLVPRI